MCGRLNVADDPYVHGLYEALGINLAHNHPRYGRFIRAATPISIVHSVNRQRRLSDATWWLLMDKTEAGFKPSKYTSFNTRYDKLNKPGSAGYQAWRHSRCIIVVRGFGESEFQQGQQARYHDFIGHHSAIALGGLCREWIHPTSGEIQWSCSVITRPPHPRLAAYHSKSMPLILPQQTEVFDTWLDSEVTHTGLFDNLLKPALPVALDAVEIDKPGTHNPIAEPFTIAADLEYQG